MRSVGMDVNAGYIFGEDVYGDVSAFADDEYRFSVPACFMCKDRPCA